MKATLSTVNNFWIAPNALRISLNALGNPNYVQIALSSGAVIMAFIEGIIEYDVSHNYRRWPLVAYPTVFESDGPKYVYARIPRKDDSEMFSLIIYSSVRISVYGEEVDSDGNILSESTHDNKYFYIYLAEISSVQNGSRQWIENLIDSGKLSTDEYVKEESSSEWKKMFSLDKITDSIIVHLPFVSAIIRTLKIGPGSKTITDIKRSTDPVSEKEDLDTTLPSVLYVNQNFLSKTKSDTANEKIIFSKGADFNDKVALNAGADFGIFEPGLTGHGGKIDKDGHGEMRSLRLWESLEVPELRYNRVSVYIGIRMDTFGGGIIESVSPDNRFEGVGTATLKLEDGEYGAVEEGDLVMGIWHDENGGNSGETTDNHIGDFTFAGFKTVYFVITGVSGSRNEKITYMLRALDNGGNGFHPFPGMHFAGRGNIHAEKKGRLSFTYSTTEYSVSLTGVTSWDFRADHYYEIHGNLEGFKMPAINSRGEIYTKEFHGHGQVFGNAYIFGKIDQFERLSFVCMVSQSLNGVLMPGETETVTVTVLNGYGADVTEKFKNISVTRNTGDAASDRLWNAKPEHQQASNPFTIAFSDLGIDGIRQVMAVFEVTATDEVEGITAQSAELDYYN